VPKHFILWLQPLIAFLLLGGMPTYASLSRNALSSQSLEKTCAIQNGERKASLNRRSVIAEPLPEDLFSDIPPVFSVTVFPFLTAFSSVCSYACPAEDTAFPHWLFYPKSSPATASPITKA